jgi:hypothetical protein
VNPVGKPGKTGSLMPVEAALARLLEMAEASPITEHEYLPLANVEGVDTGSAAMAQQCHGRLCAESGGLDG